MCAAQRDKDVAIPDNKKARPLAKCQDRKHASPRESAKQGQGSRGGGHHQRCRGRPKP